MCSKTLKTHLLNFRASYTTGPTVFNKLRNIDKNILKKNNPNISTRLVDMDGPEEPCSPQFFAKQNKKFNSHCV